MSFGILCGCFLKSNLLWISFRFNTMSNFYRHVYIEFRYFLHVFQCTNVINKIIHQIQFLNHCCNWCFHIRHCCSWCFQIFTVWLLYSSHKVYSNSIVRLIFERVIHVFVVITRVSIFFIFDVWICYLKKLFNPSTPGVH